MAQELSRAGRVTVWPLLHDWSSGARCVMAYATAGHFGDMAVLGVVPVEGNVFEPGDLFAMAGRHEPGRLYTGMNSDEQRACWLACVGFSARLMGAPGGFDMEAEWAVDMARTVTLSKGAMYGHAKVMAGRIRLIDGDLEARARALIPAPQVAA
ncbi:hypothetical protein [Streptomyces sp. NPDC058045]|uniref:hypothetical protein n=1 Tax=Streptomyces sp. NPDC058045 TaxID=3346311 RepID=UPI0036E5E3DC